MDKQTYESIIKYVRLSHTNLSEILEVLLFEFVGNNASILAFIESNKCENI